MDSSILRVKLPLVPPQTLARGTTHVPLHREGLLLRPVGNHPLAQWPPDAHPHLSDVVGSPPP